MIVVLKQEASKQDIKDFISLIEKKGLGVHLSEGVDTTIIGLVGDTSHLNEESFKAYDIVSKVMRVQAPYKMANRAFHPDNTLISINNIDGTTTNIGEPNFSVIAGPCSVESEEQIIAIAEAVKKSGAKFLRGGAFKPRTSPYAFQGMGCEGIELLLKAKKATGLPIVTELMAEKHLDYFADVDVIQIGARNMQNFDLLKELGHCGKPILLKRGLANTAKELLMSAEYIMSGGNEQIILCERGIRSFDNFTRNVLDLGVIPFLKKNSHLPVIVDPSHATGLSWMVEPMAKAALAAGADGIIVEVHNNPQAALCDGEQSITPIQFDALMKKIAQYAAIEEKNI
ncbi:MAG: 3-deoxy-7-phosphoheptulonate synthase [Spirochaetaceae bacterium]|nr:3-deoxy-7-phosphoheptulonate synthase [Spirochaetaceae bacterium]